MLMKLLIINTAYLLCSFYWRLKNTCFCKQEIVFL